MARNVSIPSSSSDDCSTASTVVCDNLSRRTAATITTTRSLSPVNISPSGARFRRRPLVSSSVSSETDEVGKAKDTAIKSQWQELSKLRQMEEQSRFSLLMSAANTNNQTAPKNAKFWLRPTRSVEPTTTTTTTACASASGTAQKQLPDYDESRISEHVQNVKRNASI